MADTTHELSILARARDQASPVFRTIGTTGKRAMEEVGQGSRSASAELAKMNAGVGRVSVSARDMGAGVKRALSGVTAGIAAGSAAAGGFQKNIVGVVSSLASGLAGGGPAGLAIAGIGLAIGAIAGKSSSANDQLLEMKVNLERMGRVRMQGLLDTFDRVDDLELTRRAGNENRDPAFLKRADELKKVKSQAEADRARARGDVSMFQDRVNTYQPRSTVERYTDFWGSAFSSGGPIDLDDEPKKKMAEAQLHDAKRRLAEAEKQISEADRERAAIRGLMADEVTRELERQLRITLATTDAQKLQVQLDEQRKEVLRKSDGDPRALAMFDELASRLKMRQRRSDEDAFRARIDPIEASTAGFRSQGRRDEMIAQAKGDPAKVAAAAKEFERATQLLEKDRLRDQLAKSIRDANGDTAKIQEAQAIHAASLANLAERTKNSEAERKRNAQDLLLTMEEQLEILSDTTGEVEKRIRREHELKAIVEQVAGSGAEAAAREAQKRLHEAEIRAEQRGTQGQYTGDHMDKGLAAARARRRKALHEEKYASGGWAGSGGIHDTFDMQGNVLYQDAPGGGVPNRGDFNGLYGPQNTAGPGSRGRGGRGPGSLTPSDMGPGRDPVTTGEGVSYVHRRGSESDEDVLQKLLRANYGDKGPPSEGGGDLAGAAGKVAESSGANAEASKAAAVSLEGAKTSLDASKGATDEVATHASAMDQAGQEMAAKQGEIASMLANLTQTQRDWIASANRTIEEIKRFIDGFGTTLGGP